MPGPAVRRTRLESDDLAHRAPVDPRSRAGAPGTLASPGTRAPPGPRHRPAPDCARARSHARRVRESRPLRGIRAGARARRADPRRSRPKPIHRQWRRTSCRQPLERAQPGTLRPPRVPRPFARVTRRPRPTPDLALASPRAEGARCAGETARDARKRRPNVSRRPSRNRSTRCLTPSATFTNLG